MFAKVLIADDLESINIGVSSVLGKMDIPVVQRVNYCDDALLKVKAAYKDGAPFDLVITDLSFKTDHREQSIRSGDELALALKLNFPQLKVIVYSVEERIPMVRKLMKSHGIDAYVCKGRRGLMELEMAIESVLNHQVFVSPQVASAMHKKTVMEIEDYDIELLKHLAKGMVQDEIAHEFKLHRIKPYSLSSVEKRIGLLRIQFGAKNATQLIATAKDLGLI
jgi:DNA-binding NarL/FixJ family response regulator